MKTEDIYKLFLNSEGFTTDSRTITPGTMFFALKGENFDGNTFALQALKDGAKYAVVDDKSLPADERLIRTEDVLTTLQDLARYHRVKLGIKIVGLTGTNGKTTTKELISAVLAAKYKVSSTEGNLNNHIGVPMTILKMGKDTEVGVVEMGASSPGEIETLVSISRPDLGLITNVGKAHLLGFGSFEGVKKTKGELYDFLMDNGGTALYNIDNPHLCEMVKGRSSLKTIPYGFKYQHSKVLETSPAEPFLRLQLESGIIINTNLIGAYNADNVMAALAVGKLFDVEPFAAAKAIENYVPSNNRSQLLMTGNNTLIVDAYNANPTSMRAALENFGRMERGTSAMVIGDMLELGVESQNEHRAILDIIKNMAIENMFFVGEEFAKASLGDSFWITNARFFKTSDDLREYLRANPLYGNTMLVKGSRGTKLERILNVL